MGWAGYVARMGEERGVYRVLVGKPEGKRPLGRPRRRWVDNIRIILVSKDSVFHRESLDIIIVMATQTVLCPAQSTVWKPFKPSVYLRC